MNDRFRDVWTRFDPDATNFIKTNLREFLFALGTPLGFDESFRRRKIHQELIHCCAGTANISRFHGLSILGHSGRSILHIDETGSYTKKEAKRVKLEQNNQERKLLSHKFPMDCWKEKELREALQLEVSGLTVMRGSDKISSHKEVSEKETRCLKPNSLIATSLVTSVHCVAAEDTAGAPVIEEVLLVARATVLLGRGHWGGCPTHH
jgi:hypothetical protein